MTFSEISLLVGMLALFIGMCVAAIAFNLRLHKKLTLQFKQLADTLGLEVTEHPPAFKGLMRRPPSLYGHCKKRELSIYAHGYGLDNTRQTDTAIRLQTRAPKDLKFSFGQQHMLSKFGQVGRLQKQPMGKPSFDRKFSLHSNRACVTKTFDDVALQMLLVNRWHKQSGLLTLEDQLLTYIQFGLPYTYDDRKQIEGMVELCCELAKRLDMLRE